MADLRLQLTVTAQDQASGTFRAIAGAAGQAAGSASTAFSNLERPIGGAVRAISGIGTATRAASTSAQGAIGDLKTASTNAAQAMAAIGATGVRSGTLAASGLARIGSTAGSAADAATTSLALLDRVGIGADRATGAVAASLAGIATVAGSAAGSANAALSGIKVRGAAQGIGDLGLAAQDTGHALAAIGETGRAAGGRASTGLAKIGDAATGSGGEVATALNSIATALNNVVVAADHAAVALAAIGTVGAPASADAATGLEKIDSAAQGAAQSVTRIAAGADALNSVKGASDDAAGSLAAVGGAGSSASDRVSAALNRMQKRAHSVVGTVKSIGTAIKGAANQDTGSFLSGLQNAASSVVNRVRPQSAGDAVRQVDQGRQGVTNFVGGLGLGIATSIGLGDVLKTGDAFERMRVSSGKTALEVAALRDSIFDIASESRVSSDQLNAAYRGVLSNAQDSSFFAANAKTIANEIQIIGGSGEELGESFAQLSNKLNIKTPAELAQSFATLRLQLKGLGPDAIEDLAPKLGKLGALYAQTGNQGLKAAADLGAVYAVVRQGSATPREAASGVASLISYLQDRQGQTAIQSLNIPVFKDQAHPEKGMLPLPQIIKDVAVAYGKNPIITRERLGSGFVDPLRGLFGELQQTGKTETLDKKLAIIGDPAKDRADAAQLGQSAQGSANAINNGVNKLKESFSAAIAPIVNVAAAFSDLTAGAIIWGTAFAGVKSTLLLAGVKFDFLSAAMKVASFTGSIATTSISVLSDAAVIGGGRLIGLGRAAIGIGAATPIIGTVTTAVSGGFAAIGATIMATPVGWIIAGIAAVAVAGFLIYEYWSPIKAFVGRLWDDVTTIIGGAWDVIAGIFTLDSKRMIGGLTTMWDGYKGYWVDLWDGMTGSVVRVWSDLKSILPDWLIGGKSPEIGVSAAIKTTAERAIPAIQPTEVKTIAGGLRGIKLDASPIAAAPTDVTPTVAETAKTKAAAEPVQGDVLTNKAQPIARLERPMTAFGPPAQTIYGPSKAAEEAKKTETKQQEQVFRLILEGLPDGVTARVERTSSSADDLKLQVDMGYTMRSHQ